ncbi:AzlC family ABC transporter permease [Noviherbaspirillum denitrificans]|uniref:Branched-chain amino acid ABC transporter permease n=1 Tax=Noviherbaspirillum denitrificans TaxID=1968433 RepID=A0A254TJY4_9BURK|nr:AzlC family ABC transporter permease [Noviherbaspirillum denitrificans]OWW22929.1 branched-chain amino acid ABC transporter permease [Noviherbaspirillum denitrificans]
MQHHPTRLSSFAAGARDTVPMLVGAAPFGMIFGTLVSAGPLAAWQGQLMSLGVFAGSSQFIAAGLMAGQAGMLVIWFTTFIVNLRHMLYAAALLPHVAHLPARWRWTLGFLMTDETFAVMNGYYSRRTDNPHGHWYFLGSCLSMYLNWQAWTLVGLVFGAVFPELQSLGLDYAMVATFIAIIVPQLNRIPHLGAALAAGTFAYLLQGLPYKLGLMLAVLAGVATGMALTRWNAGVRAEERNLA